MTDTKPLLKWVGGKTQILDKVLNKFPKTIENYYEPFIGGASVLIGLLKRKDIKIKGTCFAFDVNSRLIGFYKSVQQHPEEVWKHVQLLKQKYEACKEDGPVIKKPKNEEEGKSSRESMYYWLRTKFNGLEPGSPESAALFLFLNKTCFRGVSIEKVQKDLMFHSVITKTHQLQQKTC